MEISSPKNTKVKDIRKLEQLKYRRRTGTFFIGGPHLVLEALAAQAPLEQLILCPELWTELPPAAVAKIKAASNSIPVLWVSPAVFASLSSRGDQFYGCAAVARQQWQTLDDVKLQDSDLWLGASEIQYPANLGTMMRTADAVGARGIIVLGESSDPYDSAAVRASQGAVFAQTLVRADSIRLRQWLAGSAIRVLGTSPRGSIPYRQAEFKLPCLVLVGNERWGLSEEEMNLCSELLSIPMVGRCDSLNAAVAAGLILYEVFWQNTGRT